MCTQHLPLWNRGTMGGIRQNPSAAEIAGLGSLSGLELWPVSWTVSFLSFFFFFFEIAVIKINMLLGGL